MGTEQGPGFGPSLGFCPPGRCPPGRPAGGTVGSVPASAASSLPARESRALSPAHGPLPRLTRELTGPFSLHAQGLQRTLSWQSEQGHARRTRPVLALIREETFKNLLPQETTFVSYLCFLTPG